MKIVIHGYGAMGKLVNKLALEKGHEVVGIIAQEEVKEKIEYDDLLKIDYDVLIDFSYFTLMDKLIEVLDKRPKPCVIATTKLSDEQLLDIEKLGNKTAVFQDYNTSYGVYVLNETVKYMTDLLKGYDIEVIEKHHKYKKDAPSGTAKRLLSTIKNSNVSKGYEEVLDYSKVSQKEESMIGVHAIRSGNIVGIHEVIYGSDSDIVSIKHEALNKDLFAHGALKISEQLIKKENGLYKLEQIFKGEK